MEDKTQPLASKSVFLWRVTRYTILAILLVGVSWLIGILGYHELEHLSWIDSVLNAAMILGGMGPVNPLTTNAGKLFASFYALFSGIVFLVSVGVLVVPIFHRILHRFHLESAKAARDDDDDDDDDSDNKRGTNNKDSR